MGYRQRDGGVPAIPLEVRLAKLPLWYNVSGLQPLGFHVLVVMLAQIVQRLPRYTRYGLPQPTRARMVPQLSIPRIYPTTCNINPPSSTVLVFEGFQKFVVYVPVHAGLSYQHAFFEPLAESNAEGVCTVNHYTVQ